MKNLAKDVPVVLLESARSPIDRDHMADLSFAVAMYSTSTLTCVGWCRYPLRIEFPNSSCDTNVAVPIQRNKSIFLLQ